MSNVALSPERVNRPVTSAVFDLSPEAERGRQRAIARLKRHVKRDAKRGNYDLVNKWLDAIQNLETSNHAEEQAHAQARIDVAHNTGREPSIRDLIAAGCDPI